MTSRNLVSTAARRRVVYNGQPCPYIIEAGGGRVPVTTARYEAARAALTAAWDSRPPANTPERELYELVNLKDARTEVRAAWIEAAQQFRISLDKT